MIEQVRAALARHRPEYAVHAITAVGAGLENVAFDVNGEVIVRVSTATDADERADLIHSDAAILDAVAPLVTVPIPTVLFADPATGLLAYRRVAGVPLLGRSVVNPDRLAADLGEFLGRLHAAPREPLAATLPVDDEPLSAWLDAAASEFDEIRDAVPRSARATIEDFLGTAPPPDPDPATFTPCHNDLGVEHILVDAVTGAVTGIIDWSDAAIADPMHDLARLFRDLGPAFLDQLLAQYAGPVTAADHECLVFYARCALIEDLAHGLRTGAPSYSDAALANLPHTFA